MSNFFFGEFNADFYAKNGYVRSLGGTPFSVVDKNYINILGDSYIGIWCADSAFSFGDITINICHPVRRFSAQEINMAKHSDDMNGYRSEFCTLFDGLSKDSEAGNLAIRRVMHYLHLTCDIEEARCTIMNMIVNEELSLETAIHFAGLPVRSTPTTARLYPNSIIKLGQSYDSLRFIDADNFDPIGAVVELDASNCVRWAQALPAGFSVTTDGRTVRPAFWDESRFEFAAPGIFDLDDDYPSAWYIDVNPKDGRHSFCLLFDRSEENKKTVARLLGVA